MKYKKTIITIFSLGLFGLVFVFGANLYILSFGKNILVSVDAVPTSTTALVFGGGMKDDGVTMSEMQEDRVKQAVALYTAGKIQTLMVTGDDGANNANEVRAMASYALENGVPEEAIRIDPHGYNTYKSCDRAAHVYGVTSTVAISQSFHLSRITYFCSLQGIQVIPLAADLRDYGWKGKIWVQGIRESLARLKAVVSGKSDAIGNVVVY